VNQRSPIFFLKPRPPQQHMIHSTSVIELRAVAERYGYTIVTEFLDTGISWAKGHADSPARNEMIKAATQWRFDTILVWSIDRLGRILQNLVELLNELQSMRIDLMFLQQGRSGHKHFKWLHDV
jgi:DNA invertase Pin-like site-specific DNA recombinase